MTQKQQVRLNVDRLEERALMSASNLTLGAFMQPIVQQHGDVGHFRTAEPTRMQVNYHMPVQQTQAVHTLAKQAKLVHEQDQTGSAGAPGQAAPGSGTTQTYYAVYYRGSSHDHWTYYWSFESKHDARSYSHWIRSMGYETFVYRYAASSM